MLAKYYVYMAVVIMLVGGFVYQDHRIDHLETKVLTLTTEKSELNVVNTQLKSTIYNQNKAIEEVAAQYTNNLDRYEKLKNKPPEIRYKKIYKEVPVIIKDSNECDDIKALLDSIRNAGY